MSSRTCAKTGAVVLSAVSFFPRASWAEPLRLRGDAIAEARAPAGLVILQAVDKEHPLLDAEALVWTGARARVGGTPLWTGTESKEAADVLVLVPTVK